MNYYFAETPSGPVEEAASRVTDAFEEEGFGVITPIDVKETFKKTIGTDFRNYRILGACNLAAAYEALTIEDKLGTMLSCNVIVQETDYGKVEVAAIDPALNKWRKPFRYQPAKPQSSGPLQGYLRWPNPKKGFLATSTVWSIRRLDH